MSVHHHNLGTRTKNETTRVHPRAMKTLNIEKKNFIVIHVLIYLQRKMTMKKFKTE